MAPPPRPSLPLSWEANLIDRYRRYLLDERGLVRKTVIARSRRYGCSLTAHSGRELQDLDAGDVSRFVIRQCRGLSTRSAERLVNGLRSFLRYALVEGLVTAPFASAVPSAGTMERRQPAAGSRPRGSGGVIGKL